MNIYVWVGVPIYIPYVYSWPSISTSSKSRLQRANCTMPSHIRDPSMHEFWYLCRSWSHLPVNTEGFRLYTLRVCDVCMYTHTFIYTHIPESVTLGVSVGISKHLPTPCVACCICMIQSKGERSGRKGLSENQGGFLENSLLCRPLEFQLSYFKS